MQEGFCMKKSEIRPVWIDQIKTAIRIADKVLTENPEDGGTCNFDRAMVKRESLFTYQETIDIFKECGLNADKMCGHYKGWIDIVGKGGIANSRTRWAKAFAKSLEEQGFETSMYYQMD